ncbi:MAG: hypothetical protein ACODAA_09320 [Gemmatimonadota bacterium]
MTTSLPSAAAALTMLLITVPALQAQSRPACEPECPLTASEARADLEYLLERVERRHPDPFRHQSRDSWLESTERISATPPCREPSAFFASMLGLLAGMRDGHMDAYAPEAWEDTRKVHPIKLVAFPDGVRITAAAPPYAEIVGARVLALGGVPVDEALRRLRAIVPSDNEPGKRELLEDYLRMPALLHALGLAEHLSSGTMTVESDEPSSPLVVRLHDPGPRTGLPVGPPRRPTPPGWVDARQGEAGAPWQRKLDEPYWIGELPELQATFLQLNQIVPGRDGSLTPLAERLRAELARDDIERLVVDLRFNRGGDATLYAPVLRAVAGEDKLHRPGGLYVLISSYTFSAAVHLAAELERLTHATFVGEPTAAPPNHFADAASFELPHSKIEVETSTLYWQKSDPRDDRRWIHPDIAAPIEFEHWRADMDPAVASIERDLQNLPSSFPERPSIRNWTRESQQPARP